MPLKALVCSLSNSGDDIVRSSINVTYPRNLPIPFESVFLVDTQGIDPDFHSLGEHFILTEDRKSFSKISSNGKFLIVDNQFRGFFIASPLIRKSNIISPFKATFKTPT